MYLTVEETAEYLSVSVPYVENLILQGKIRALHDSDGAVLIYKDQFKTHFEQLEKYKKLVEEVLNEPIPEDLDVKDED
ncbi:excisionase family DNA-binding protein [Metabacillus fastidiosus]|uniref:Excisionase family DNA-binding protein n=1 Tax=Metabacillus fastidiosus TaxID=1458 RepID=A0ABU6NXV6_9BACI|nr:excisionase family DNA-binding protein [Metabacillus fastidiosus]MEC2075100.1 excisionase family DNA-binding protein [Metabacillus fastidiosus]MED4401947.1 excisionase family DNA-binding protein [Metabacillus fastidiosus]MED4454664.1 excisionase family DNA-binding protein [Metabacillus fastidiosus]MED4460920.1 excisionase family DNA-binding protein [Metabacillus fastidiosus]MED4533277.1 excisionase family DNA-binding protein [Metabacillus fastidiosus]